MVMKCLLTSDLHYALKQYDWLMQVASSFDAVIIAGDHLDISSAVAGQAQTVVVLKYLERLSTMTRVLTCSGNHDLDSRGADGEKTAKWFANIRRMGIAADGNSIVVDDTLFTICPWWDGPLTRQDVGRQLAREAANRPSRWVWVYHSPPIGSPTSWDGSRSYGETELRQWIDDYRPDLVMCGHVHASPFCQGGSWVDLIGSTWVFNAGYQIGPVPTYIILDTDEGSVIWLSTTRWEVAKLCEPFHVAKLADLPDWLKVSDQSLGQTRQ